MNKNENFFTFKMVYDLLRIFIVCFFFCRAFMIVYIKKEDTICQIHNGHGLFFIPGPSLSPSLISSRSFVIYTLYVI